MYVLFTCNRIALSPNREFQLNICFITVRQHSMSKIIKEETTNTLSTIYLKTILM